MSEQQDDNVWLDPKTGITTPYKFAGCKPKPNIVEGDSSGITRRLRPQRPPRVGLGNLGASAYERAYQTSAPPVPPPSGQEQFFGLAPARPEVRNTTPEEDQEAFEAWLFSDESEG